MARIRNAIPLSLVLALGLLASPAYAAFSPEASLALSNRTVRGNPALDISVAQDEGEEELKSVVLKVDEGFKLAKDPALTNGEQLGEGEINIAAGPGCAGAVGSAPITVPVEIVERDRTPEEINQGVKAVYVVDLEPVTTIDLKVRGSASRGWTLQGRIPSNEFTCPPFSFDATIFKKAAESGKKIIVNPADPGRYRLAIVFNGLDGSRETVSDRVRIRG